MHKERSYESKSNTTRGPHHNNERGESTRVVHMNENGLTKERTSEQHVYGYDTVRTQTQHEHEDVGFPRHQSCNVPPYSQSSTLPDVNGYVQSAAVGLVQNNYKFCDENKTILDADDACRAQRVRNMLEAGRVGICKDHVKEDTSSCPQWPQFYVNIAVEAITQSRAFHNDMAAKHDGPIHNINGKKATSDECVALHQSLLKRGESLANLYDTHVASVIRANVKFYVMPHATTGVQTLDGTYHHDRAMGMFAAYGVPACLWGITSDYKNGIPGKDVHLTGT